MTKWMTLACVLALTGCAMNGPTGECAELAEAREWTDLGPAPVTTRHPGEYVSEDAPVELEELTDAFSQGTLLEAEDGHEYLAPSVDGALRDALLADYEALDDEYDLGADVRTGEGELTGVELPRILWRDNRTRVTNRAADPFTGIGRYTIQFSGADNCDGASACELSCTGTLIGDRYVAIAAHCIYDRGENAWIRGNVGVARGQVCFREGSTTRCTPVVGRKISPTWRNSGANRARHDYALLKVQHWFGGLHQMRLSSISSRSTLNSLTVRNHGYPGTTPTGVDGSVNQLWGMNCSITDIANERLSYNCDTTGGHSGGPVYYRTSGGGFFLLAIHSGSATFGNTGARVAGSDIRDWLVSEMSGW
ncbi:MAG TPA: trypsin-like peptidase domain-containing protein [Polyangiaceae bacterium LLY-WYZ-15_(1-7)]|nr:trypsin-like peptidase domain-containing protein [Polyangiaceae bacterium LLY-WYZ-15_(1-7)]